MRTRSILKQLSASMAILCLALTAGPAATAHAAKPMLTDAEISGLQETVRDANRGTRLEFKAEVLIPELSTAKLAQYRDSGRIPYQIVCTLNEIKERGGKSLVQRQNGRVEIRVLDKDGKVVDSASMALEKMCAS